MTFEITEYIPSVQPDVYPATLTGVETIPAKNGNSEYRRWQFTLADGSGRNVPGSSSMQTTPGSKAGKWIAALLGRQPAVGEKVELLGRPCKIVVELNDSGYEKVANVLPRQAAQRSVPPVGETVYAAEAAGQAPVPPVPPVTPADDELPF